MPTTGAAACVGLLLTTDTDLSAGISLSLSCALSMSAALDTPSSILLAVRQDCNLWSAKKDDDAEETSDLESKGDSDPEKDPPCMATHAESSSKVERATGTEKERVSR